MLREVDMILLKEVIDDLEDAKQHSAGETKNLIVHAITFLKEILPE